MFSQKVDGKNGKICLFLLTILVKYHYIESMKSLHLARAKDIAAGDEVDITFDKQNEDWKRNLPRKLGTLEGKATVTFADDFEMTDEELINLE